YGAVYFRKSNPPREDWERDYQTASEDGNNVFRHWFIWGAIEISPGVYDWEDYDRQMDLAAKYGIRTVIAEMTSLPPEWIFKNYPEILYIDEKGNKPESGISPATATGGHAKGNAGAICLNTSKGRELAGGFLTALAQRYKGHPSLMAYDVWNECFYQPDICYHEATRQAFADWLKMKYKTLPALKTAWHRYSLNDWDDIAIPHTMWPWMECQDWQFFRKENFYQHMKWRIDRIRSVDPDVLVTAHGIGNSIDWVFSHGSDHWEAASHVQSYGYTYVQTREGNDPVTQWYSVDSVRSGSRGKPFWHSEAQGGPEWFSSLIGRKADDGRIAEPEDIRIWNMISFAAGARGILYPRWRPLLDGPLHGAFGPYSMDGSRNPRSEEASRIAKWANDPVNKSLFKAAPVKGEIGILFLHETSALSYLSKDTSGGDWYPQSLWGACRGFINNNIQPDWVHPDDMNHYKVLYLPFPLAISGEMAARLEEWVARGGFLIAEGCPGYFGGNLHVGEVQPDHKLHLLFGATQQNVEFMPDINSPFTIENIKESFIGGGYKQEYRPDGGKAIGWYDNGSVAMVSHNYKQGRTLLVGSHPSIYCHQQKGGLNTAYFREIFRMTGQEKHVPLSNDTVQARIHQHENEYFIWIINPSREQQQTSVKVSGSFGKIRSLTPLWNEIQSQPQDNSFEVKIPGRDVVILKLGMDNS
ncbi:MAG: beta-galactosidase, partial [Bacteroidales bacterium]|nr:beta-galactosidase [Bacteroidales bacterium]